MAKPTKQEDKKDTTEMVSLVKSEQQAIVKSKMADMLEEDAGAGSESISRDDLAIPRLQILQALSPQLNKQEPVFIKGAEAGQIHETVGNALFDGEAGIIVVPVSYRRAYIEWTPRSDGGGFVADHGSDATVLDKCTKGEKGEDVNPDGNIIVTTGEYYVLVVNPKTGEHTAALLSMSKTQLKKSRRWNTLITTLQVPKASGGTFNPAMFYRSYKLTTVAESNDQGSWYGWDVEPSANTLSLPEGEAIYLAARALKNLIAEGKVKAAPEAAEAGSDSDPDTI